MATNRTIIGAIAFAAALAGGGVAGALIGVPGSSGAQDSPTTTAPATTDDAGHADRGGHHGAGLAAAAKAIGVSEADLRTALEGGQSIAEVAKAHNVDVQKVIDAMVAEAKADLETAIADLPTRMTDLVNRTGPPEGGHRGGFGHGGRGMGLDAAATAIGISAADLRTALEGGATIAQVAKDHNVDVQKVIDAMVAEATTHLDDAVKAGQITEADATTRKADLATRITAMVNGLLGDGPGGHGGRPKDSDADDTTSTTTPAASNTAT